MGYWIVFLLRKEKILYHHFNTEMNIKRIMSTYCKYIIYDLMFHTFCYMVILIQLSAAKHKSISIMWCAETCCILLLASDIWINVVDSHGTWLFCCSWENKSASPSCYLLWAAQKYKALFEVQTWLIYSSIWFIIISCWPLNFTLIA